MATKMGDAANHKRTVVMDRDGVVVDDISREFDKRFRRGNSLPERAFKELTFISLSLLPLRRKDMLNGDESFDKAAMDYMRHMQRNGNAIAVKTANAQLDIENEGLKLRREGIDAKVKHAGMLDKLDAHNPDEERLLEDNQLAVFAALIRTGGSDKRITLIKKDYNSITGFFIKLFGKHSRLGYSDMRRLED